MIGSGNGCASHVLAIENLTKRFGALVATDDVSLAVADKTCHALIGPNGAGKTTLMQQISGTLKPDSGRIWFDGRDITTASVASRAAAGLGRTFQITAVVPTFSAHDNAALAAQAVRGTSFSFFRPAARETDTNAAARDALDHVGLADRADRLAGALSHGERRLLELAMVLAMKPKLLLLDEPMAGLGKAETAALTDTLTDIKRQLPILFVEHDMEAVFALADTVTVLVYGATVSHGAPDVVRADPKARAAYLGEDA